MIVVLTNKDNNLPLVAKKDLLYYGIQINLEKFTKKIKKKIRHNKMKIIKLNRKKKFMKIQIIFNKKQLIKKIK